jgi:hypothetical protein
MSVTNLEIYSKVFSKKNLKIEWVAKTVQSRLRRIHGMKERIGISYFKRK